MPKWIIVAALSMATVGAICADLARAQATAPDGLIHITCTVPPDNTGGISFPALVHQFIINPVAKTAWIDRECGTGAVVPAYVDQGMIVFKAGCASNNGSTSSATYTIDRYTGTFAEAMQGNPMSLSGQCFAGQKQLF